MAIEIVGADVNIPAYIDATSKALRATPYDGGGNVKYGKPYFYGFFSFQVRQGGTNAPSNIVVVANKTPNVRATITLIDLQAFFDGTAAATNTHYNIQKYYRVDGLSSNTGANFNPYTSNGQPPTKISGQVDAGTLETEANSTGCTFFDVAFDYNRIIGVINQSRAAATALAFPNNRWRLDWQGLQADPIYLEFGDALTIASTSSPMTLGDNLNGTIEWYEQKS